MIKNSKSEKKNQKLVDFKNKTKNVFKINKDFKNR